MNPFCPDLETMLRLCGVAQFGIAALNLFLARMLGWQEELARTPLLLREVFHVHAWFISVTLAIFAVVTWRFAHEMAAGMTDPLRCLAAGIGVFWSIRAVLQVTYYSSSHWRGRLWRTAAHFVLLAVYGGFAGSYWCAVFRGAK